jgi:hypothetical protein
MVVYFEQTAKLPYGLTQKEALILAFQYGKDNGVVMPENQVKSQCGGNMELKGLRKRS